MKKLVAVLLLLLAIETWGVYGAFQTSRVLYTCKVGVGPLCYYWEESALGKIIGPLYTKELESTLVQAKKSWEETFVKKWLEKQDAKQTLDKAGAAAKESLDKAGEKMGRILKAVKEEIDK